MNNTQTKNFVLQSIGIAMAWMPLHYSFYRYTLIGEGLYYWFALVVVTLACAGFIAARKPLGRWLEGRPRGVLVCMAISVVTNALLVALPYLPIDAGLAGILRYVLIAYYMLAFALLFFVWARRLAEIMYQASIVRIVGCVGLSVTLGFLLTNVLYGTPVYMIVAVTCLFVSGLCWQLCTFESVDNQESLSFFPTGRSIRRWALLWVAFVIVSIFQAVLLAAHGTRVELTAEPMWILHTGLILMSCMFVGTILASHVNGLSLRLVFSIIILLMIAYYMGVLSLLAAPLAVSSEGCLAVVMVVQRTLRIFIFLTLMVICYQDSAAPSSTFGILFLLVEVIHDAICYVGGPMVFDTFSVEASAVLAGYTSMTALILMLCFAGFLLLRIQEWFQYFNKRGMMPLAEGAGAEVKGASAADDGASDEEMRPIAVPARFTRRQVCELLADENDLTERETDVLYYLSLGYAAKKIADTLYVSPNTIATHSSRLYRKLGVHSRQELIDLVDELLAQ